MVLFVVLLSCGGIPGTCAEVDTPPVMGACFGGDRFSWDGYTPVETTTIEGEVVSAGEARFPDECNVVVADIGDQKATIIETSDGLGTTNFFAWHLPEEHLAIEVGDEVSVEVAYTPGGFGPDLGRVVVRDAAGIERMVFSVAGEVGDLRVPTELEAERGTVVCEEHHTCGDWSAYALKLTSGGDTVEVPYGGTANIGAWRVYHGGLELEAAPNTGTCPDYYVAHVAAGFEAPP